MRIIAVLNRKEMGGGGNGESTMATHLAAWLARQRLAVLLGRHRVSTLDPGMRVDARTKAADSLREWTSGLNVPFLGVLRETRQYVKSLDNGRALFDLPGQAHRANLLQWASILEWLSPIVKVAHAPQTRPAPCPKPVKPAVVVEAPVQRINATRAASLMPALRVVPNALADTRLLLRQ